MKNLKLLVIGLFCFGFNFIDGMDDGDQEDPFSLRLIKSFNFVDRKAQEILLDNSMTEKPLYDHMYYMLQNMNRYGYPEKPALLDPLSLDQGENIVSYDCQIDGRMTRAIPAGSRTKIKTTGHLVIYTRPDISVENLKVVERKGEQVVHNIHRKYKTSMDLRVVGYNN